MALLRKGADPDKLAWSLALGVVVGVNPLLGSTTLVALGLASVFRLNLVASQVGNHAMYPVELLLFPVFIKVGCGEVSSVAHNATSVEVGVARAGGLGRVCRGRHAGNRNGE